MEHIKKVFIDFLKRYKDEKEKEGFVPTIDLLIEELEETQNHEINL